MNATLTAFAQSVVSRLALAILIALALTILPTAIHELITDGPIAAVGALGSMAQWIMQGFVR